MSNEASNESYRSLKQERIDKIVKALKELPYTEKELEKAILPYIAQWLYDNYVNIESTCVIISTVTNINRLQEQIENIYDGFITLPAKSKLQDFLEKDEYTRIESVIEPRKLEGVIRKELNDDTNIKVNFKTKRIYQEKVIQTKKGMGTKDTPVVEAVPHELIVYDPLLLDQPRTFKIKWTTHLSDKMFTTEGEGTGATIKEIENYIVDAGFSHSPRLVGGAIACTINAMIEKKLAIIKQDIDNPGFYYNFDENKISVVKTNITTPTRSELMAATAELEKLTRYFKENMEVLATVIKWGCLSKFSYAMKQSGRWLPWLYLKGTAGSGKTTVAQIPLFIWGIAGADNNIGGSSVDSKARLGAKISQTCDPIIVNEPAPVFNNKGVVDMIKSSVESTTARSKYNNGRYKNYPAFSPMLFTANMYLPEDDALLRRFYVLSFTYSLRKTEAEKKRFEDEFHISTPKISSLNKLEAIGRYVAGEIIYDPDLLSKDWKVIIDEILEKLYSDIGLSVPEWLTKWAVSESLEDFDNNQREMIRSFFNKAFNQARKTSKIVDKWGNRQSDTLDIHGTSEGADFAGINWDMVNNRMFEWAFPKIGRTGTKYICFNQSLRNALASEIDFCDNLKSIGELMGWKTTSVRIGKGTKPMQLLKVPFKEFMEFLYPNLDMEVDE